MKTTVDTRDLIEKNRPKSAYHLILLASHRSIDRMIKTGLCRILNIFFSLYMQNAHCTPRNSIFSIDLFMALGLFHLINACDQKYQRHMTIHLQLKTLCSKRFDANSQFLAHIIIWILHAMLEPKAQTLKIKTSIIGRWMLAIHKFANRIC